MVHNSGVSNLIYKKYRCGMNGGYKSIGLTVACLLVGHCFVGIERRRGGRRQHRKKNKAEEAVRNTGKEITDLSVNLVAPVGKHGQHDAGAKRGTSVNEK